MSRSPLSPAYGIATGLKYGATIWIGVAVLAYGLWCAFDAGADRYAAMNLDRQETNAGSLYRTANGGQP